MPLLDLLKNQRHPTNYTVLPQTGIPELKKFLNILKIGNLTDPHTVSNFAAEHLIDLAIIGPEAPLANGVVDALLAIEINVLVQQKI